MKILFTGGSSFTGYWFIKELVQSGHQVTAPIRKRRISYEEIRLKRVEKLADRCQLIEDCEFGSASFMALIQNEHFDLFCHHAADVTNYKSPDFDPVKAIENNTKQLVPILRALKSNGCCKVLLTGSVFEQNEGAGSDCIRAVSPYGLSKGLTSEIFKFYCQREGLGLAKFVIPNPFGPFEEFRFTTFLIKNWLEEKVVPITMPSYVRDNIHVSLLAKAYADFVGSVPCGGYLQLNPSGYPESQGAFTRRFAEEMSKRLLIPCEFELLEQKDFSEPKVRLNTDLLDQNSLNWNEKKAWDDLAKYYQTQFKSLTVA